MAEAVALISECISGFKPSFKHPRFGLRIFEAVKRTYLPPALAGLVLLLASCGQKEVRIVDKVKEISMSGGHDTVYFERSSYWDHGRNIARSDSNHQTISFKPLSGQIAYVVLENMGGVPLKRDTIRSERRESAEWYLRTGTLDTNMHIHIEYPDYKKPQTDVVCYIRNRDSVYREIMFVGR